MEMWQDHATVGKQLNICLGKDNIEQQCTNSILAFTSEDQHQEFIRENKKHFKILTKSCNWLRSVGKFQLASTCAFSNGAHDFVEDVDSNAHDVVVDSKGDHNDICLQRQAPEGLLSLPPPADASSQ